MSSESGSRRAIGLRVGTVLFLASLFALHLAWQHVTPDFDEVRLRDESGDLGEFPLPFRWPTRSPTLDVSLAAELHDLRSSLYRFDLRGCLESLEVNGVEVGEPELRGCSAGESGARAADLSSLLRTGRNTLELRIRRPLVGGAFTVHTLDVRPSTRDPFVLSLTAALVALICVYGVFVARRVSVRAEVVAVVVGGVVARALYAIGTGLSARSYDWHGHLVYVSYVAEKLSIPPAQAAWETYQPPLYYALAGAWVRLGSALGRSPGRIFQEDLPTFSFSLSVAALVAGVWAGTLLFPSRAQRRCLLLYGGALAVLPGLVFFSARVSNDTLYHFLAFLFLALLLRFWQLGRTRDWLALSGVTALALLTKSHSILFVPIAFGCLLVRNGTAVRRKAALAGISVLIIAVMVGWLWVLRFVMEDEQSIVGNVHRFSESMAIEFSPRDFVVFNPLEVVRHPFVDDRVAATRPTLFWEYLFRTAHFGAFRPSDLALVDEMGRALLVLSMMLLVPMALGLWRHARLGSPGFPLCVTTFTLLGAHLAYRFVYPFSFNQDFRFSVLLAVPLSYYTVVGTRELRGRLRLVAELGVASFIAVSAALLVAIYLGS